MSKKQPLSFAEKELFLNFYRLRCQVLFFAVQNKMPSVMLAQE